MAYVDGKHYVADTPEEIARCLNCVRSECNNCLHLLGTTEVKKKIPAEKFVYLFNSGAPLVYIARECRISKDSMSKLFGLLDLTGPASSREPITMDWLVGQPEEIRKRFKF